jgi:adenylate cyclase
MKNNRTSSKATIRHRINRLPRRMRYGIRAFIHKHTPDYFPIAYKLAFIMTLLISAGMVILGSVIVSNQTQLLRTQINDFGQAVVTQLGESSKELVLSDDILSLMVLISNLGSNESIVGAVVYSDNGKVLASSGTLPNDNIIRLYARSTQVNEQSYSVEWTASTETGESVDAISFIAPIQFQGVVAGHALVTFSKAALDESLRHTVSAIVAATILMIILGIVIAFLIGDRLTRPIHRLMDASRAIGDGQFHTQIKERRNDEIGYLTEAFNNMANGLLEKSQVENAFSRFVSSNVAKQIMANLDEIQLGGKHVHGSVLFADIVGFTSLSEKLSPDEIAKILNEYFTYISMASQLYRGTIDKYMGDCAMVVFGVPDEDPEHKFNALACAVMIQKLVARINAARVRDGKYPIHFRIGVNSGTMLAGNMGSNERMQYTVVGETVNLASRLHTVADKDQIVITEHLYIDSDINWRILAHRHESIKLRGIAAPVSTYIVNDVSDSYRTTMEAQIDNILTEKVVA